MFMTESTSVAAGCLMVLACSSASPADDGTGDQGMGGAMLAGAAATAGTTGMGTGGVVNAGGGGNSGGAAGSLPSGGISGASAGGNPAGAAGTAQGGAAGVAGAGGGDTAASASAGCGKGARPAGGEITVAEQYILTFPPTYDGNTPMPVVFGFHGANNTNVSFREGDAGTKGTDFEKLYVMAYVKSIGSNWIQQLSDNFGRFDAVYAELASKHCIDTSRVFAMGHSSGAMFTTNLVCRPDARLRAVAPVASGQVNGNCRAVPALLIQGEADSVVGASNSAAHAARYIEGNGCSEASLALSVPSCKSRQTGSVTPGCFEYQSCGANPTVLCTHNDLFYSSTNHGWPCFANQTILDFFERFRK